MVLGGRFISPNAVLVLLLVIAAPIAWFASEFQGRRWLRIALGAASLFMCFGVAFLAGKLEMFNANAWFGFATKDLIDATIDELEAGNEERVVSSLKKLQKEYSPTYENRARYDELAAKAVADMRDEALAP
jgi:hypothetical protein